MIIERVENDYRALNEIFPGRFVETGSYATWRSKGTADWLLIYTLGGSGRFGLRDGEFVTKPHDIVLIKPRTLHDYGTAIGSAEWDLLWAHFQPRAEWRDLLDWPEVGADVMRLSIDDPALQHKIIHALDEAEKLSHGPLRRRLKFGMNALEQALLWCDTSNPRASSAKLDPRIHEAIGYLMAHIGEKVLIADVADACGLSVSRLAHLFQEQVGESPQHFLENERLTRARQMLSVSDQPIQNIAADLGFESAFYFSRRFRLHTGLSPRAFRARQR